MTNERTRAVAYCRVSTEEQATSLESQVLHFNQVMDNTPTMVNCGCYVDNGISGRFIGARKAFRQMMGDAELHKFDYVLCKSIKRFGRCTLDTVRAIARLTELKIPVYFEQENLDTIRDRNNILLTTMAQVAQEEYEDKSEAIKWSFEKRMQKGEMIPNPNTPLGYKLNSEGKLEVVPEEAKVIRWIYESYTKGMASADMCRKLNKAGYLSAHKKPFAPSTILYIIKNEKYKGDAHLKKWVVCDGKKIKNNGEAVSYYVEDHHEAIVSKELWARANEMVQTKKKPNAEMPPQHDIMRGKIVCAICGKHYTRTQRQSMLRYMCNGKEPNRVRKCRNESVKRTTLEMMFIALYNQLRGKKKDLMQMPVSDDLVSLNEELQSLIEQERTYLQLQVQGLLQGPLQEEYRKLLNRIVKVEDRKKELLQTNGENVQAENNLRIYNKAIAMKTELDHFDENLFDALVKEIIVYDREHFGYRLISGEIAYIRICYYQVGQDEIEEIIIKKYTEVME